MPKWEYCLLKGVASRIGDLGLVTSYPRLFKITALGLESVTDFKDRPKDVSEVQAVAQKIFLLGEEGWEMIFYEFSRGEDSKSQIWFKRQKP